MKPITARKLFNLRILSVLIILTIGNSIKSRASDDIQFNTDVLDLEDRKRVDLSQFSREGYMMPGDYTLTVRINRTELSEQTITFIPDENDAKSSVACITPQLVKQFGLKKAPAEALEWQQQGKCLKLSSLKGLKVTGDLATSSLYISIPQAWLEYSADDWDPPSRWDDGIPGLLLDYNLNVQQQRSHNSGDRLDLSGNGTTGINLGAWRLRASWQARLERQSGSDRPTQKAFDWSRYYAWRAIRTLGAKLMMGENYLNSAIFDSFRYIGASLISDDNMLPPNLRGYAPEVTGIAKTDAKVTISQQGRVLYETQVAAGPFRIQDLSDAVSGQLDVRVDEQDGSVQRFTVNTANIPYLTRPGSVRFKVAAGKPADWKHRTNGAMFSTGEFTWGVSNGWSLYGGAIGGDKYQALSAGVGRDLMLLGAISLDATQSRARMPHHDGALSGGSYRLSYAKNFEQYDSQITFAGYRFSQQNFMSMSEYLDAKQGGYPAGKGKQMYTVTLNKQFRDAGLSAYFTYTHQTYWDRPTNDRYNLMLSRYFDWWKFRSTSVSLSAYRNRNGQHNDDGLYLSISTPWGDRGNMGYSFSAAGKEKSQNLTWADRLSNDDNYSLSAGDSRSGGQISGYYTHEGDTARINASASYNQGQYRSLGLNAQGGMTLTPQGGALHRINGSGSTRLLVDTDGVADVPVRGYGSNIRTNRFGKAVITDISSYYRNSARIDIDKIGDNAEAINSVVQATLTEGAIGYRRFNVISGAKAMAIIKLADGSVPPFSAKVVNARGQTTGLINDDGSVYLSGIKAGETMNVEWDGKAQCEIRIPIPLPTDAAGHQLLLPCETSGDTP